MGALGFRYLAVSLFVIRIDDNDPPPIAAEDVDDVLLVELDDGLLGVVDMLLLRRIAGLLS